MLSFRNITKVFKAEFLSQPFVALDDVSFEVPAGSMVGFLGANGAGKTTSLKIIMDFIRPTSGEVKFSQELGSGKIEAFKQIGYLPERPYFYPNLTGEEFLRYLGSLSDISRTRLTEQISHWAPRFKIDYALNRQLKTYSKGMLQRIGFLSTVLHNPQMIILDEPLSGLDPIGRKELKDAIVEVHQSGKTVFFSSHIVPDIEEICDRVIFLKEGKLVYDGPLDTIMSGSKNLSYSIKYRTNDHHELSFGHQQSYLGNLYSVTVPETQKTEALKALVLKNYEITNVELIKPSLEEIFYNIKVN